MNEGASGGRSHRLDRPEANNALTIRLGHSGLADQPSFATNASLDFAEQKFGGSVPT